MYQEKVEVPPEGEDDDDSSNEEKMDLNEEEYVKNLIKEFKPENDSLEELRRMIRETKKEIEDYADDLYTLKSSVSEANLGFREIGKGVNEGVFWELDCRF
jgi:predicted RNase H-like nuclease (RuvC/YqgF family)